MRELREHGVGSVLSSEVLSVLQHFVINNPLFPNLETLRLWSVTGEFVPFIPLFLSPRTTCVDIAFLGLGPPKTMIASVVTTFSTICPNLRDIDLRFLPRDPMITAAVSGMLLANNRNTLQRFHVDSPLTDEASEVIYKLPSLCELSVVVERDTLLPPAVLPNLTELRITYDHGGDWLRIFRGATLDNLKTVTFYPGSEQIGDFLEAFARVALATSIQNSLSTFCLNASCSWNPNYSSLLPFTELTTLVVAFSCDDGCSSTVDDDVLTSLARTMPQLEHISLGDAPCQTPTGVTIKGLAALAYYCLDLSTLCIHFQVATLDPSAIPRVTSGSGPTTTREDCALTDFDAGATPIQGKSKLMIALTLLRIFPYIGYIEYFNEDWEEVADTIHNSKQVANASSKGPSLSLPRSKVGDTSPRSRTRGRHLIMGCSLRPGNCVL